MSRGDASGPRGTGRPRPSGTSRCASQKPRKASPPGSSGARALVRQPPGLRSERTRRPGGGLRRLQPCTRPSPPSSASECACHFLTSRPRPCPSRSPPRGLGHRHVESGDCGPELGGPKPRPGAWGRAPASRCLWTAGSDPTRPTSSRAGADASPPRPGTAGLTRPHAPPPGASARLQTRNAPKAARRPAPSTPAESAGALPAPPGSPPSRAHLPCPRVRLATSQCNVPTAQTGRETPRRHARRNV